MKTKRSIWLLAAAFCFGVFAVSAARAAQSVIEVIPDDALGFALVNRVGQTDAKIRDLAEVIGMPLPGMPESVRRECPGEQLRVQSCLPCKASGTLWIGSTSERNKSSC